MERRLRGTLSISPEQLVPLLEMEKSKKETIWVGRNGGKCRVPILGRCNLSYILGGHMYMPKVYWIFEWVLRAEVCIGDRMIGSISVWT